MTADTYDPIMGFIIQGTGNNNNSWGDTFSNAATKPMARAIGGATTHTNTGGTLDLSGSPPPAALRQDIDAIHFFNGTLTSDLTVVVPNLSKKWIIINGTSAAFNLYWKTPTGVATQIPQSTWKFVICDGNDNVVRLDRELIGSFRASGKAAAGAGELACNGASLLRASFPDLFTAIGTTWGAVDGTHFTLPNLTNTGRFLRSSSGSLTVGTYQANQNLAHTHTMTGAPSVGTLGTDSQGAHVHAATDSGHGHPGSTVPNQGTNGNNGLTTAIGGNNTAGSAVGLSIATGVANVTIAGAGAHTHNITGAPGAGSLAAASAGGTEARPEAAVVLICIVY